MGSFKLKDFRRITRPGHPSDRKQYQTTKVRDQGTVADETSSKEGWAPGGREFQFAAMPPPGSGMPLTRAISRSVLLRGTPGQAEFYVGDRLVAVANRRELRDWLKRGAPLPMYEQSPLILRRHREGVVWFQLDGHMAPMILTPRAITLIRHVLRN